MKVKITERGWAGHGIISSRCLFRRNTLIEHGKKKIVVSSIGNYIPKGCEEREPIGGCGRYFETVVYHAMYSGGYIEIDFDKCIEVNSEQGIYAENSDDLDDLVDNKANEMHDDIVSEIREMLIKGEIK